MDRFAGCILLAAVAALAACSDSDNGAPPQGNVATKRVLLVGAQENPPVTTGATATGFFSVDMDTGAVAGTVSTFGISATAAHIHEAAVGVNAGVIVPLVAEGPNAWGVPAGSALSAAQRESLRNGNLYVNLHTSANPGGEIRAQLGRQVFFATLAGAQEVPAVGTSASGLGRFAFDPDTRTLGGTVTTTGISGTAGHIHTAAVGVVGPVTIAFTGGPVNWELPATVLTPEQAADLLAGRMYANVHTPANPGGEIRGQLYTTVAQAVLTGAQEAPPVSSSATGLGWLSVNPATRGVAGRIETSLTNATNAHVHRAVPGVAGGVVIPMSNPSPGVWVIREGATISDELLAALLKGELYYNVHTAANPGGEIRGQLIPAQ